MQEELSIEEARRRLGNVVDRARLAREHTLITRNGTPAAVVVGADWYAKALELVGEDER